MPDELSGAIVERPADVDLEDEDVEYETIKTWYQTLTAEQQIDEINRSIEWLNSTAGPGYEVTAAMITDGLAAAARMVRSHEQWVLQQAALSRKRSAVTLIIRPFRVRVRGGFRRGRRVTLRRAPARSPDRPRPAGEDEIDPSGAAA